MQKEIPILFSTAMVQAILAGRKTQTRRTSGLKAINVIPGEWRFNQCFTHAGKFEREAYVFRFVNDRGKFVDYPCPYGKPGDLLYVRETWRQYHVVDSNGNWGDLTLDFAADNPPMVPMMDGDGCQMWNRDGSEKFIPWKPGIHLPKAKSRIWVEVTDVRVERLQDISESDARFEGIERGTTCSGGAQQLQYRIYPHQLWTPDPRHSFRSLWQSINPPDSWAENPWVWVVSFKVVSTNGRPK
jgi:hypothetical protein